jgi:hypothetical protein
VSRPRYWVPAGTDTRTDGGYLVDPETERGPLANAHLARFEALADAPCLVLFGAPGAGKSTERRCERDSRPPRFPPSARRDARQSAVGGRARDPVARLCPAASR